MVGWKFGTYIIYSLPILYVCVKTAIMNDSTTLLRLRKPNLALPMSSNLLYNLTFISEWS